MSQRHNQIVTIWEVIESTIRCAHLKRVGLAILPASSDDNRIKDAYTLFVLAIDDLLAVSGYPNFSWSYKRYINTLVGYDVDLVMRTFKRADDLLLSVYHGGTDILSYDDFKHRLKVSIPSCGALLAPLEKPLSVWSSNKGDSSVFWLLHTAFSFLSRVRFDQCDDLQGDALQNYLAGEDALLNTVATVEEGGFFAQWFPDTPSIRERLYSNHVGRHGPGSVAEDIGTDFVKKSQLIGCDALTEYLDMVIGHNPFPWSRCAFKRVARVVFVAKTALKLRTICAEPVTLQWYEQGFREALYRYIDETSLRNRICLTDQTLNRQLAREGSVTGDMVTIDLSAASDSVAYDTIRQWTYNTALSPMVLGCRSTHAELPDGSTRELRKFAPMGSALCFPFLCLVFCSIVEAAITEYGDRYEFSRYRVYGDDIIVERRYLDTLIRRLNANGFSVNVDKSFYHAGPNIYRESCGGEYLNGKDVSPIRLPRRFDGWSAGLSSAESIERLVALCNATYGMLPSVRSYVILKLLKLRHDLQPLFSDNPVLIGAFTRYEDACVGLYSPTANNYHLIHRWNKDLQKGQYKTYVSKRSRVLDEEDDGEVLVYEYLMSTRNRTRMDPRDRVDVRGRRECESKLSSHWV